MISIVVDRLQGRGLYKKWDIWEGGRNNIMFLKSLFIVGRLL